MGIEHTNRAAHATSNAAAFRERAPHLVYVAWGFPPARTGGVHRALATANAFASGGWRVSVLTVERSVFTDVTGTDEALERRVHPGVTVHRLPFSWPAQATDLADFSAARVLAPRLWAKSRTWRDRRVFPEAGYGPWRAELESFALDLHRRDPVDLVMATTNPQVSVTAGTALSEHAGVPFVVDFRDAWTLHTYSGRRRLGGDSPEGRWEARAIAEATEVWFVNEPLRRWHAQTYPDAADKMFVVMNGYDTDMPPPRPFAVRADTGVTPGLTFGYLGTMTPVMPMREFVEGWRYAHREIASLHDAHAVLRGYLGYYATPDPGLAAIIDTAGPDDMTYGGPVSKTEVADTYSGFDVLVLVLGGGEFVTSGKVFEYMSTGRPVVSVLTEGNAAAEVLAGYPRHHPAADLTRQAIGAALAAAGDDVRSPGASARAAAAQTFAGRYRRDVQLAPRVAALRELVRR